MLAASLLMLASVAGEIPGEPDVHLNDLNLFPPSEVTEFWYTFTQQYQCYLEDRWKAAPDYRKWEWYELLQEARLQFEPWYHLSYATWKGSDNDKKLSHLRILRELIGYEDYYTGKIPFPVPIQNFAEWPGEPESRFKWLKGLKERGYRP